MSLWTKRGQKIYIFTYCLKYYLRKTFGQSRHALHVIVPYVNVCARVFVCACVWGCVCVCVRACMCLFIHTHILLVVVGAHTDLCLLLSPVMEVPCDNPFSEDQTHAYFRDIVLGIEYRKPCLGTSAFQKQYVWKMCKLK